MTKKFLSAAMSFVLCVSSINVMPYAETAETKEEARVSRENLALNKTVYFITGHQF